MTHEVSSSTQALLAQARHRQKKKAYLEDVSFVVHV
jgi:hypothetical protein